MPPAGTRPLSPVRFARQLWREVQEDAVFDSAAQLGFYLLYSLFPLLFFLATLLAYLPLEGAVDTLFARLGEVMPAEALRPIHQHLLYLLRRPQPHLLTLGALATLYSASRGADALRKALNVAFDVRETRPFWKTNLLALTFTALGAPLGLVGVAMVAAGGKLGFELAEKLGVQQAFMAVWTVLRWPCAAGLIMLAASMAYTLLPDRPHRFRLVSPGSVCAAGLWLLGTWGFTWYAGHLHRFELTYGSLGGAVLLLSWLYLGGLVFMLGGEVDAVLGGRGVRP